MRASAAPATSAALVVPAETAAAIWVAVNVALPIMRARLPAWQRQG